MRFLQYPIGILIASMFLVSIPGQSVQAQTMDDKPRAFLLFDRLEYVPEPAGRPISFEATGWVGGDVNRLWLRGGGGSSRPSIERGKRKSKRSTAAS